MLPRMNFRAVRVACVVVLLAAVTPGWAQKDKDKKDDKPKVIVTAGARARARAEVVALLRAAGVSRSAAGTLAQDIVNGYDPNATAAEKEVSKAAEATAQLIENLATELTQLGAKQEEISKVVQEIADRGLTDGSPGGAARNLAGLPGIDAIMGDGAKSKLPQGAGRNADAIARALVDAIVEMHTVGLTDKDESFRNILDTILRDGLYGSEARNFVRGTTGPMVDEQRRKQEGEPPADGGGDKKDTDHRPPTRDGDVDGDGRHGPPPFVPERKPVPDKKPDDGKKEEEKKTEPAGGGKSTGNESAKIDLTGVNPNSPDGTTESTTETKEEREARKKREAEEKAKEDKDKKEEDDEDEDDKGPPRDPNQPPSNETSHDPGGEQAYHGKPTLKGIIDRLNRLQGRQGQQTNPAPEGNDLPDRTVPIRDPKTGLIGNPGSAGTRVPPQIDSKQVPKPGPKPGTVDPERDSKTNSDSNSRSRSTE